MSASEKFLRALSQGGEPAQRFAMAAVLKAFESGRLITLNIAKLLAKALVNVAVPSLALDPSLLTAFLGIVYHLSDQDQVYSLIVSIVSHFGHSLDCPPSALQYVGSAACAGFLMSTYHIEPTESVLSDFLTKHVAENDAWTLAFEFMISCLPRDVNRQMLLNQAADIGNVAYVEIINNYSLDTWLTWDTWYRRFVPRGKGDAAVKFVLDRGLPPAEQFEFGWTPAVRERNVYLQLRDYILQESSFDSFDEDDDE